jgi:hypothetical protein
MPPSRVSYRALLPLCALALVTVVAALPAAAPEEGTGRATSPDSTAAALFAALAGPWACAGAFADGRPLAADLLFEPALDGRALRYRHVDRPPNTFAHEATWAFDAPAGHLISLAFAAMGDAPASPALFVAEAWTETSITLVADTLRAPPWAPNRFTYTLDGDDALRMVWEIGRGGGWHMGDYLDCQRGTD